MGMTGFLLLALLAAPARGQDPSPRDSSARPQVVAERLAAPPRIDGVLEDDAWKGPALPLGEWLTYNPLNGDRLAQTTEVRVGYDDRAIYFAFHCVDPEPDRVRSTLSRRDQLWNDDWVGLSLDSVGNGQSSYDLFVNPAGVQADILTTTSAGENVAPDWVWESAGRRTAEGYDVEIRLPLTTIRFKSGREVRMGILFWRRVSRLGMSASWPDIPAGKSVFERHASLTLGALEQPLTLEVIPSLTYSRHETRVSPDAFGPVDSEPDAGISARYGLTSSVTVEGTVNPDFSQVESDAFQVQVNQRFPVFYPEKRPFFMEGMGTFELAGTGGDGNMRTAVHTRVIEDPLWGAKSSGTAGRVAFAVLAAGDEAPGRAPADGGHSPFRGERKAYSIARGQYSLGRTSYVGALLTDTELADGHNRVAATDVSLKLGNHFTSGTFIATTTRSPDGVQTKSGLAGQAYYAYETKPFLFATQAEHYDADFQMDTAFVNQTGVTQGWSFVAPSFYPDPKKTPWLKRVVPFVFTRYGKDRVQGGNGYFVLPGIRMHLTRQGYFRFDAGWGREPWAGQVFPTTMVRVMGQAQLFRWLNVAAQARFGRSIYYDPAQPYSGRERDYTTEVAFQPCARFNQSVSWSHVGFDRASDGTRVYTVDVLNTRTTFQVDRHFFLRAIVQYDSSRHEVLTDFLASWELLPGTVAYAGYGSVLQRRGWDGSGFTDDPTGVYRTSERGLFFKASYIHRF
jgi:hypothetical protein